MALVASIFCLVWILLRLDKALGSQMKSEDGVLKSDVTKQESPISFLNNPIKFHQWPQEYLN